MKSVRLFYEKGGRAKYISHLDMNRLMMRVLRRTKLPIWYTEGFNPRPFVSFALPLSLGFISKYDIMDFKTVDENISFDELKDVIKSNLPEGIKLIDVESPVKKPKEITFAEFTVYVSCNEMNKRQLLDFFNSEKITVKKVTKSKSVKEFDVKPKIFNLQFEDYENGCCITLLLPAGSSENVNPILIFDAAKDSKIEFEIDNVIRGKLFDKNMALFR